MKFTIRTVSILSVIFAVTSFAGTSLLSDGFIGTNPETGQGKPGNQYGKPGTGQGKPGNQLGNPGNSFGKPGTGQGRPGNQLGKPGSHSGRMDGGKH